jgi:hypothetical protein
MRKKSVRLLFVVIATYQNWSLLRNKLGLAACPKENNNNNNNKNDKSSYENGNIVAANKDGTVHHVVAHRNHNNDDGNNNEKEDDLDGLTSWDITVAAAVVTVTAIVFTTVMLRSRSK